MPRGPTDGYLGYEMTKLLQDKSFFFCNFNQLFWLTEQFVKYCKGENIAHWLGMQGVDLNALSCIDVRPDPGLPN